MCDDQQYTDFASDQSYVVEQSQDSVGPPKKSPSDEDCKLFVGGVSWDTEVKDLKGYFSNFGEVGEVNIKTDPESGKSRGFAFVSFVDSSGVENALSSGPHMIKGKTVEAKRAKARPGIKKIFVGGLETDFSETDIRSYFKRFGDIETVELPFDKIKNQRRQFIFVTFGTEAACEEACRESKQTIGNKECDVKKATTKPDPGKAGRGGWNRGGYDRGGRGGGRGRGRGGYNQQQDWNATGDYGGFGGYNQGGFGGYDFGYGGNYSGGGGYGAYNFGGNWNFPPVGGGMEAPNYVTSGYGQQQSSYGKARRGGDVGGQTANPYHPYNR